MAVIQATALRKIIINLPANDLITIELELDDDEGGTITHEYNLRILNEEDETK